MKSALIAALVLLALPCAALAAGKEVCIYVTRTGEAVQVNSRDDIPRNLRAQSKCMEQNEHLARPQDVELKGTVRTEDITSPIGRIRLRWPRKTESLFGRTPLRAMTDAAQTLARTLSKGSFPSELQRLNADWQVVFLDADLPETQIPSYLVSNCHPGWMTPPANIYIVGQRVAGGCGGGRVSQGVADSQLTEVLIHEMGHAVEAVILQNSFAGDRMRAEGFATWFEQYAAGNSSIMSRSAMESRFRELAKQSLAEKPRFSFEGTANDYARASMYFTAIVDKRGLSSLMDVYKEMATKNTSFFAAVQSRLDWPPQRLDEEAVKMIKSR